MMRMIAQGIIWLKNVIMVIDALAFITSLAKHQIWFRKPYLVFFSFFLLFADLLV